MSNFTTGNTPPNKLYFPNEFVDELIVSIYPNPQYAGRAVLTIRKKMKESGREAWAKHAIIRRANELGLTRVRGGKNKGKWCEEEIALLRETADHSLAQVKRRFDAAGFTRSASALMGMRSKLMIRIESREGYTATTLAAYLGISVNTVCRWIRRGLLHAEPRGLGPSDHHREHYISEKDVFNFLISNVAEYQLARIASPYWFVNVLTKGKLGVEDTAKKSDRAAA